MLREIIFQKRGKVVIMKIDTYILYRKCVLGAKKKYMWNTEVKEKKKLKNIKTIEKRFY